MTFHEANFLALRKIGVVNATRLKSPQFICNVVKEHLYNATDAVIEKKDQNNYVLTLTFGDVQDTFDVTMSYNETDNYYKVTNFK